MKTDAKLISGAMAAEAALAKKEGEALEESLQGLPDDHPTKVAAMAQ